MKTTRSTSLTAFSVLAFLLVGRCSQAAEPLNLVTNPSFELDKDGDELPDNWLGPILPDGTTGAMFLDQALPMNGAKQVTVVFMEEGEHVLRQAVKLKPSTEYTLGCWIRGRAARGNAWVRFKQTEPAIQQWESKRVPQGHTEWTLYQTTFTTAENHQAGQVEIVWNLSLQGLFRFDFVSLSEGKTVVTPPNTPPRLRQDHFDVQRDTLFGIAEPGLLLNDEDADQDTFTVAGFSQGKHGKVHVAKNGAMTYQPVAGFSGEDSFEYRVSDRRGGESWARVILNVAEFPQPKNLLSNGSFESRNSPKEGLKLWNVSQLHQYSVDPTTKRSGHHSLRVEGRDSPQFARQENLPVRKGKRYRLSAWIKGEGITDGAFTVQYVDENGRRRWSTTGKTGTFDWQKIEVEFGSAREAVEGGAIDLLAEFKSGRIWVDDVTLEEFEIPIRVFIDGYSVTAGVTPILKELGKDAQRKGILNRKISITRSPSTDKTVIRNAMPHDVALLCSWAVKPKDNDFMGEVPRLSGWKKWFTENAQGTKVMLFHWQPWGLDQWPEGFTNLERDYRQAAQAAGIPIVPTTLAFKKCAENSNDPKAMLRKLYSPDYHHAGRVGNYLKACCAFAAVTGKNPVGLTHLLPIDIDFGWPPETLTEKEARMLQQTAWDAWKEANNLTQQ